MKLDGEQLTISARVDEAPETNKARPSKQPSEVPTSKPSKTSESSQGFSFTGISSSPQKTKKEEKKQVSLQRKAMEGDVPELPLQERGATLGMRVPNLVGRY